MRPADGEVVVGLRRAEVVDARGHELGRLERGGAVEDERLVERAVDRALGAGPVVADDVVDERVLEHAEVLERVDEPPDVVVGVLEEAGVDLHLPREHRLQLVGHVVPGGDLVVPRRQLRLRGHDPSSFWRARISSRNASQPPSKRPLYLSDHSFGT